MIHNGFLLRAVLGQAGTTFAGFMSIGTPAEKKEEKQNNPHTSLLFGRLSLNLKPTTYFTLLLAPHTLAVVNVFTVGAIEL